MSSRWIVCVVLLAGAVVPANSSAATGDLSYAGCFGSSRAFGCTKAPPGVGAAEEPARTVIAPDGVNAFTVGGNPADPYAGDGLMRLSRAADGTLSFVSCFSGSACAQFPPWTNPMDLPRDLVVSPDGKDLYVISEFSGAVAHFRLDAHGDPAFVDCIPCDPGSGAEEADVFGSPMSLAISPDGRHLYVGAGSFGQALITLDRRSDGSLEFASCNGGSGAPACDPLPGPCAIPLNETCRGYALDSPRAVAVSRDGTRVFVASGNDGEYAPNAISTFRRAADGSLDFLSCLGYATAGCHSTAAWPIVGAQALAVDREGDDLYVGAEAYSERGPRDVVSHLEVAADGTLRVGDCIAHQAVSGCGRLPTGVEALRFVRSISLSPDGGSLYAGAVGSPAITHFRVGPSGALSFAGCVNGLGCTVTSPSTGSTGVTVSPDGRNVYGHAGNTIVVYRREQTAVQPVPPPPPPPPPPAVRTGDADAIGQSAAILSARVNPLGTDTTYAFEVGATDAYGRETEVAPAGAGSERHWVSSRISGLEPGTTYHYRVVATSAAGVSRGADHTFTTEGRPPAAPEGLAPVAEKGPADRAVGYQINSGHTGFIPDPALRPPLTRRWSRELGLELSYPLIAEGRVFVVGAFSTPPHRRLYALDADTGGTLWWRGFAAGPDPMAGPAYANGKVFAAEARIAGGEGLESVAAFDAATGKTVWALSLPQYPSSSLTAVDGVLYATGNGYGGDVFALRGADGALLWSRPVLNGDDSSPTVLGDKLFVSYSCHMYGIRRATGGLAWHRDTGCIGAGGSTVIAAPGGRLYVRQDGFTSAGATFSADTGTLLRQFEADSSNDPAPAFAGRLGYFVHAGVLTARNVETGATMWSFTGEGRFGSSPIAAGSTVYIGSAGGVLYALDRVSGRVLWSADAGPSFLGSERPMQLTWTGLGAGNGLLVTPAGNRLTAWSPPARGPTEGPAPPPSPGPTPPADTVPSSGGQSSTSASEPRAQGDASSAAPAPKRCSPASDRRGPVKVVSGIRDGVARLQGDTIVKGRYAHRVGFAVSRSYRGTVTISAGALSFLRGERVSIRAAKHRSVRKASAKVLLPGPGCYTLVARGPGWRQRFTFAAR